MMAYVSRTPDLFASDLEGLILKLCYVCSDLLHPGNHTYVVVTNGSFCCRPCLAVVRHRRESDPWYQIPNGIGGL